MVYTKHLATISLEVFPHGRVVSIKDSRRGTIELILLAETTEVVEAPKEEVVE